MSSWVVTLVTPSGYKSFVLLKYIYSSSIEKIYILPGYAADEGIDKGSIATLVSTIGITNTIGRIVCGWISDHPKVREACFTLSV